MWRHRYNFPLNLGPASLLHALTVLRLHHIWFPLVNFPLVNLGFTMPNKLYSIRKIEKQLYLINIRWKTMRKFQLEENVFFIFDVKIKQIWIHIFPCILHAKYYNNPCVSLAVVHINLILFDLLCKLGFIMSY